MYDIKNFKGISLCRAGSTQPAPAESPQVETQQG